MDTHSLTESNDLSEVSPRPTFRQEWLVRSCREWDMSDMRRRYWTLAHAARIAPSLDRDRLHRSFHDILAAHQTLRWSFQGYGEDILIDVLPPEAFVVEDIDARALSPAELQARVEARSLDVLVLDGGPLVALSVYQTGDASVLLLRFHHVLVDGWAVMVLIRELVRCYVAGTPQNTADTSFAEFAFWQRQFVNSDRGHQQLDFWREYLADLPSPLHLPYDRPDTGRFTSGAYVGRRISARCARMLSDCANSMIIPPFRLLLAAFNLSIYVMTDTRDAPVASAVTNRLRRPVLQTIGWVANNVYFRTPIEPDNKVHEYWKAVASTTTEALNNQDYPVCLIEDAIGRDFPGLASALDQVSLGVDIPHQSDETGITTMLQETSDTPMVWGGFTCELIELPSLECNRDLTLIMKNRRAPDGTIAVSLSLNYRGDVFEQSTAERILELYAMTLENMLSAPEARIRDLVETLRRRFPELTTGMRRSDRANPSP